MGLSQGNPKKKFFRGEERTKIKTQSLEVSVAILPVVSLSSSFPFSSHSHNTYKPTLYNLEKSPNQPSGTSLNLICSTNCSQMPQSRINYSPFYIPVHTVFSYIHTYVILCAGLISLRVIRVETSEHMTTETTQKQFDLS